MSSDDIDIYRNRLWSKPMAIEMPQPRAKTERPKMKIEDLGKVKSIGESLQKTMEMRRKLLSGEPLELIVGTGNRAQSLKFTPEYDEVVRNKMITDITERAETLAKELRGLGVPVDLPI